MKLPKKITPCPIIEAIVEIRYDAEIPSDAIFGIVFREFKNIFPNDPIKLPIMQLPEKIRNNDPSLLYKPHHRLSDDKYLFQIGPRVISLNNTGEYVGWDSFSSKMQYCFKRLIELDFIKKTKRFGLRYINFFNSINVFEKINLSVLLNEKKLEENKIFIKTALESNNFIEQLQVSNNSKVKDNKGSIIDIDIYLEDDNDIKLNEIYNIAQDAHIKEKELFFYLLKDEYLKEFKPEY
jgi:uncharacterized protein (TIGR04255 family)